MTNNNVQFKRINHAKKVFSLLCIGTLQQFCTVQVGAVGLRNDVRPFSSPNEQCIIPAAIYHGVNHEVLRAILKVESGLRPDAMGRNDNGSFDVGIGQINSIHFAELAKFGIGPFQLRNACIGIYVAAWQLRKGMNMYGNTWRGIASYHSSTPYFNQRYQALLNNELVRSKSMTGMMIPVPPLKNSAYQNARRLPSGADRVK